MGEGGSRKFNNFNTERFRMLSILITGGNGMLGTALKRQLLRGEKGFRSILSGSSRYN